MHWFWLALAIALVVVELTTTELVSIWFAISAAIVAILSASIDGLGLVWQVLIFLVVAAGLLLATRRVVKKLLQKKNAKLETNLGRNIGAVATVTEEINNENATGAIKINGLEWSARSENGEIIAEKELVIFKEIKGNKAIVVKKESK